MEARIQILLITGSVGLLLVVLELVRRRRLLERYALLWLLSSVVLIALAVWRDALESVASLVGIYYAPSALFVVAFGFVLILLLHFSLVVSGLANQNKVLAQHVGILREEVDRMRRELDETDEDASAGRAGRELPVDAYDT
jgi:hypothetical protein